MPGPKNIKTRKAKALGAKNSGKAAPQWRERADDTARETTKLKLEISCSPGLVRWLIRNKCSIAFTSYKTGKLFLVGVTKDGAISFHQRNFDWAMGLWADPRSQRLHLVTHYQIWRFENILRPGQIANGTHDRCFVPRQSFVTSDVLAHDIGVGESGQIVFVNTSYSCLALTDPVHSFRPLWKPPFISELAAGDRCHLNGLAMDAGHPRYVSAVSRSDTEAGWRKHRGDGGIIMDVTTDAVLTEGLSMPHSPRIYRNELYVLDSGRGNLCRVDRKTGAIDPIAFCSGFVRGLAIHNNCAIVGLSLARDKSFAGLELDNSLKTKGVEASCGLQFINLQSGETVEWLRLDGDVEELYDVAVLPNVQCPMAFDFVEGGIHKAVSFENEFAEMKTPRAADALAVTVAE